jgi:hypothetical protein
MMAEGVSLGVERSGLSNNESDKRIRRSTLGGHVQESPTPIMTRVSTEDGRAQAVDLVRFLDLVSPYHIYNYAL